MFNSSSSFIVVRQTTPLGAAFTSRMVRNHGAGLPEDSPTRASPEPQVRPPAPCFTVRSRDRDTPPGIFGKCALAPPIFSAAPMPMMPSRAGVPIEHA
jgi:hypothetical protein